MATPIINIHDVPQAIQLALGPAFLLTGIAGMLNVMTGRLARIIDRGRRLTETGAPDPRVMQALQQEIQALDKRRYLASAAIAGCTLSALLVCTVIAALFLETFLDAPLHGPIGLLFMGATLALVVGLAYFLREVHLANTTIRIAGTPLPPKRSS
jgi:MFS family permease